MQLCENQDKCNCRQDGKPCSGAHSEFLEAKVFSVAIDGSSDSHSQLHPIVVTYLGESGLVESRLLSLCTLKGQASGRNIGNLILEALASFHTPVTNCVAFCSDNANFMLGKKNGVAAVLTEVEENLIKIECACHLINLAAEKGALCHPAKVDEVIFYYLEKSAKRKEALRQFQEIHDAEFRKILKHVPTR